jgi:hypothetical protein
MSKLSTRTRTIGTIVGTVVLATLLVVVGMGVVLAEMQAMPPIEPRGPVYPSGPPPYDAGSPPAALYAVAAPVSPSAPPPSCPTESAEPGLLTERVYKNGVLYQVYRNGVQYQDQDQGP